MPRFSQSFEYSILDKVTIIEINRPGVVTGLNVDSTGSTYRVNWWSDGTRRIEWLYEWEIKPLEVK